MDKVKEMANQMLKELGKGSLSNYPALERQLELINNLCEMCEYPGKWMGTGGLRSRQVIASTIVQYFIARHSKESKELNNFLDVVDRIFPKQSQGKPSPITGR